MNKVVVHGVVWGEEKCLRGLPTRENLKKVAEYFGEVGRRKPQAFSRLAYPPLLPHYPGPGPKAQP